MVCAVAGGCADAEVPGGCRRELRVEGKSDREEVVFALYAMPPALDLLLSAMAATGRAYRIFSGK
jgi:hypothetical protein